MNCSYSSSVMPASRAADSTGYSAITHGAAIAIVRSRMTSRGLLDRRLPLLGEVGALARALGRPDRDECVGVLPDLLLERRRDAQHLERRLPRERAADLLERDLEDGIGAAAGDLLDDRLDQRPRERRAANDDLPPGLDRDRSIDEERRKLVDARVAHARVYSYRARR